jgi:hypothetical protein
LLLRAIPSICSNHPCAKFRPRCTRHHCFSGLGVGAADGEKRMCLGYNNNRYIRASISMRDAPPVAAKPACVSYLRHSNSGRTPMRCRLMQATAELDSIRIHSSSRLSLTGRLPLAWDDAEPAAWTAQDHTQAVTLIYDSPQKAKAYAYLAMARFCLSPAPVMPLCVPEQLSWLLDLDRKGRPCTALLRDPAVWSDT